MNGIADVLQWLGSPAISLPERLALDVLGTMALVVLVYHRLYRDRDYVFTYGLINLVTFWLAYLLSNVRLEAGFALGLFAVFGILRYRTEAIRVRHLTYLFVVIGLGLVNALAGGGMRPAELLLCNASLVGAVWCLETLPFSDREESSVVHYDRLDLLGPASAAELMADLRARTRLPVERFEIGDIDLLRDAAHVTIHYRMPTRRSG